MNLKDFLSKKGPAPKGKDKAWLRFCTLDVTTGSLWAGDPHLANADDGHVTKVPAGRYVVEGIGMTAGRQRVVSRLRVRLESAKNPTVGKELGDTGTDSAMVGICDIKAFDKACGRDAGEEVQEAIEAQTDAGFGVIKLRKFPGAVMPFIPTGSDGGGPVLALMSGGKRVGIELSFTGEDGNADGKADKTPAAQPTAASVMARDSDRYIRRLMPDGEVAAFWLGGELKADQKYSIWSSVERGPVHYRIRQEGRPVPKKWSPMKQKSNEPFSAFEMLGREKCEIDFQVGTEIYSSLKITPA